MKLETWHPKFDVYRKIQEKAILGDNRKSRISPKSFVWTFTDFTAQERTRDIVELWNNKLKNQLNLYLDAQVVYCWNFRIKLPRDYFKNHEAI